jgi:predicted esterase
LLWLAAACTAQSSGPSNGGGPTTARAALAPDAPGEVRAPLVIVPDASAPEGDGSRQVQADEYAPAKRDCDAGRPGAAIEDAGDRSAAVVELPRTGTEVAVPGDTPVYVLQAAEPSNSRALVYLHGRCGRIHAVDAWPEAARAYGTLIALRGDKPCPEQRRRWGTDIDELHQRILKALRAIKKLRRGALATDEVTLFGYSQGATRAEGLARRYPRIYRRVILGGPPTQPSPAHLSRALAIAVFGGDSETTEKMQLGAEELIAAGKKARFFTIPCAGHGDFGPEAERVMAEILSFVGESEATEAGVVPSG